MLKGQIHEALGCSDAAIECYRSALGGDVYCYEALHSLTSNYMLTPKDGKTLLNCLKIFSYIPNDYLLFLKENQLIQSLPIENQCSGKEAQLVKYVYATKLSRVII